MQKDDILIRLRLLAAELPRPTKYNTPAELSQRSYSRWAASEVIKVVEESDDPPEKAMEWFLYRLNAYSCGEHEYAFIFSIAYDTVLAMYDEVFVK